MGMVTCELVGVCLVDRIIAGKGVSGISDSDSLNELTYYYEVGRGSCRSQAVKA